jgi:hypothetical protein
LAENITWIVYRSINKGESHMLQRTSFVGVGLFGVLSLAAASRGVAQVYPPYGPNIPVITNTDPPSGAYHQDREREPAPNPWNEESIWNMKVEGYNDNQARPIYQPLVVNQNGREILYLGNLAGTALNPLTGVQESNGTSIVDVTDVKKPKFLFHIPGPAPIAGSYAAAGAQMARVCGGNTLPNASTNGTAGHWYLLRAFGNAGADESHQIWDVTNPASPKFVTTVLGQLSNTHKSWWECDTGIAYLVAGSKTDGWQQSGSAQPGQARVHPSVRSGWTATHGTRRDRSTLHDGSERHLL